jgi:hypothetical protein
VRREGVKTVPPMPWRILIVVTFVGVVGGAIFGFIRGLSYLPTLPFAISKAASCSAYQLLSWGCYSWERGRSAPSFAAAGCDSSAAQR